MNKIIASLMICLCLIIIKPPIVIAADYETTTYLLKVPEFGSRGWGETLSKDIISIDTILSIISSDLSHILVSRDECTAIGGVVGRLSVVSPDNGETSFIQLYSGK